MKFMKRESSLALVMLFVALLALPSLLSSDTKKVEASAAADGSKTDAPKGKRTRPPQTPSGNGPANDNCANAINVTCPTFTDTKNTSGATEEAGEPLATCTDVGATIWYTYTNNTGNTVIVNISLCNSTPVDTTLAVFKVNGGPCDFANFASVACNDDSACGDGFQSQASFNAEPGATYKIQVGGFDSETGSITTDITCQELSCPPIVINGTLGSGDPNFEGTQTSGNALGRLNRNGISSTCAAPKTCLLFTSTGLRAFDAYSIPNDSGQDVCVNVNLSEPSNQLCNIQSNAYLTSFDPNNICTNYLADPGLSTGVPPTPTNFSFVVPAGQTLVLVVMTTNPGESGCPYTLTVLGDLCAGFDLCVQQDFPKRFLEINSSTGDYRYTDCSKNIVREGTGSVSEFFCKINFSGSGTNSSASALLNPCTKKGDATINLPGTPPFGPPQTIKISDTDITNNDCQCPE